MKLKDFLNECKNKANNQDVFTLKKRKLKNLGLSKKDLLDLEVKKSIKKFLR